MYKMALNFIVVALVFIYSVGTYDGRDLVIERSTGRIVFRDKE